MTKRSGSGGGRHRVDHGGRWIELPIAMIDSPQFAALSLRATKILIVLVRRFNGFNNGRIGVSMRELGTAIGSANHKANAAAIAELEQGGFIAFERMHAPGSRMSREYRLTFATAGKEGAPTPATNDWRAVFPSNEGKQFRGSINATVKGKTVAANATEGKRTVAANATALTETSHVSLSQSVAADATHIVSHRGGEGNVRFPILANRPSTDRSDASAFMHVDELRYFATSYLGWASNTGSVGAQTKLAAAASIPGGTLSKFLGGRGLSEQHRHSLQFAIARAWPTADRPISQLEHAA